MQKIKDGLWKNLQKHLVEIYATEKAFEASLVVSDNFPFNPATVEQEKFENYLIARTVFRDLFVDEVSQLSILVKAIRKKGYAEDDKKQLFLLLLGYLDIAFIAFDKLSQFNYNQSLIDEELNQAQANFERLQKFVRLNIKGVYQVLIK